jgi:uncharacterized protein (TIGR01777 family)
MLETAAMKRVLVTGGTGFVGRALVRELVRRGDQVTVLSRDVSAARGSVPRGVRVAAWSPEKAGPWRDELSVVDAVVHLAGAPVAVRWSEAYKTKIRASRVESTRQLVEAIAAQKHKPEVLVSGSAIGFYGSHRPEGEVDEEGSQGKDFLAGVCEKWEEAARAVAQHGVRSVQLRIGVVLGPGGGALGKMVMPMRVGVASVGKGDNYISWVHLDDVVGMALMALDDPELSGPINVTSPHFATQRELVAAAASVLGRPALRVPKAALRIAMGEASEAMLGSLRAFPRRAIDLEYAYHYARLVPALEASLIED